VSSPKILGKNQSFGSAEEDVAKAARSKVLKDKFLSEVAQPLDLGFSILFALAVLHLLWIWFSWQWSLSSATAV
jgi:hypothetical protein